MTIKAYFEYREQDATRFWNTTNKDVRLKGILDGTGTVSSVSGQLKVTVAPFVAQTYDGMTVVSDDTETLSVTDNETYYIVLYAKYQLYTTPILTLQAMNAATYAAHPEKDYLITFVRLDIPPAAIEVLPADYNGAVRDGYTPSQRDEWRNSVATYAALPTDTQEVQDGDIRLTLDTHTAWVYNSSTTTWEALSTTSTLENVGGRQAEYFADWNRAANGDGIIGGNDRYGTGSTVLFTTDYKLSIHEHANIADTIGIGMIHAVVNGHRVDTRHIDYTLSKAKPVAGTRYDLVYLEVWREETLNPETEQPTTYGGGTVPFSTVRDTLEDLDVNSDEIAGSNFDVNQITTTDNNRYVITRWRVWDMATVDSANLANPHYQVDSGAIKPQNIDGNNYSRVAYGIFNQGNIWRASCPTAYDDYSWAIPLLVIRRTSAEDFTTNDAIKIIRADGYRYVWEVYPTAEVDLGARLNNINSMSNLSLKKDETKQIRASGFLNYLDLEYAANLIRLQSGSVIHVDGFTYETSSDLQLTLPAAPSLPTEARHDLVYLEVTRAMNPDERVPTETDNSVFTYYDFYRGTIFFKHQINLAVADVGLNTTVDAAMTAAGFSAISPGLYRQSGSTDERSPADNNIFAIPVALVHRFNQDPWNRATNPNGGASGTRPDSKDYITPTEDEVLDLRHKVVLPGEDIEGLLQDSQRRLLEGKLHTKMAQHPIWSGYYGTRLIEQTSLSVGGMAGARKLPADPNGIRYIWSDAAEQVVFGTSFASNAPYAGTYVTWSGPPPVGFGATMVINAPSGAYIMTGTDGNPIFAAQGYTGIPNNDDGPIISDTSNGDNFHNFAPIAADLPWVQTAWDGSGRPIQYTISARWDNLSAYYIDPAGVNSRLHVYYWICYDQTTAGDGHGNSYNSLNQGLEHVPDEIISIENYAGGDDPAIGPLARELTYTNYSGTSLTITSADIAAAYPEFIGTIYIYGALRIHSDVQKDIAPNTTTSCDIDLDDSYGSITITPSVPFANENLTIMVIFHDTNIEGWFDFRQHTKSLMGPIFWETLGPWIPGPGEGSVLLEPPWGRGPTYITSVVKEGISLGGVSDSSWERPGSTDPHVLVYWRASGSPPGTPWQMTSWAGNAAEPNMRVGCLNSHVFSFMFGASPVPALSLEFLFVMPMIRPVGPSAKYLITSQYTPYQGVDPVSADLLEEDLHGVCVSSGRPMLTTRGSNDPRTQALKEYSGQVDWATIVSTSSPTRSLNAHLTNDTYCLVQAWREDYKKQRHVFGNACARLPKADPTKCVITSTYIDWGQEFSVDYEVIPRYLSLSNISESTDLTATPMQPTASPFDNTPLLYPMNTTGLLTTGSKIEWPASVFGSTKAGLRNAGIFQGERGWTLGYEPTTGYYYPISSVSYLPGGSSERWAALLRELGIVLSEAPQFFSMGFSNTQAMSLSVLGVHSALISPNVKPGVLKMQISTSNLAASIGGVLFNAVGGTFDAFIPHRNLILSWNAG